MEESPIAPEEPILVEVPEESPIAPEMQVQTTSDFFKIARAVDGDSLFNLRVGMALEISGIEKDRANLIHVAKSVVDFIDCTVEGTVVTERVTDKMISDAISEIV